jgi:NTE family protein
MEEAISPKIGLALSGGGARAMAFHLGCLRALDRLGLLHRIDVLSTVSGGSVIGVFFHAHDGDFASFEAKMRGILSRGLAKRMFWKLLSPLGLKVAAAFALIGAVAAAVALIRTIVGILEIMTPPSLALHFESFDVRSPLHRFASRTSLLEAVLDDLLFGGASMSDLPAKPHLVVNATELRTGSAFRFGTRESGSWRWGKLHRNDVSVAHAVAASAAYPLFLPAFDETFTFDDKDALRAERVVLTDGGIYDNLGLGCLWPDRTPDVSLNVTPVDTIICCSAGYGLRGCRASSARCSIARRTPRSIGCMKRSALDGSSTSFFPTSANSTKLCRIHLPTSCAAKRLTHIRRISMECRQTGSTA